MARINPVTFPIVGDATNMSILVFNFHTDASTCKLYYKLTTDNNTKCTDGYYELTEQEFAAWGYDNSYLDTLVATRLGVTII